MTDRNDPKPEISAGHDHTRAFAVSPGTLYIVSTPIGNLRDITLRALDVLRGVDIIACEDTRVSGNLLSRFGISGKRLLSYYSHNENQRIPYLLEELGKGQSVAQISDAGTPGLSDPGNRLVTAATDAGIPVYSIPGASALTALTALCHFPARSFHFEGFLPTKKGRQTRLRDLAALSHAVIFYESTHRILKLLEQLLEVFGDRDILVGRELTKLHETQYRGTVSGALEFFQAQSRKGEFCLIIRENMEVS